jgi:transporter family protein
VRHWQLYACASAICAALIPILGRVGLRSISPELATLLRSVAMTAVLIVFALATGAGSALDALRASGTRAIAFVFLTGLAGALSWIFYFKALELGEASRVAPLDKLSVPLAVVLAFVVLGERPSGLNWLGVALVTIGAVLAGASSR